MRFARTFPRALARDRRGAMTVLAAGGMTMLMGCLALAVDLGSLYLDERRLQGIADAAALAAAADLGRAQNAVDRAIAINDDPTVVATAITTGNYRPDPAIAVDQRFKPSTVAPDAARVVLTRQAPLFFGRWLTGQPTITIRRTATAARASARSSVGRTAPASRSSSRADPLPPPRPYETRGRGASVVGSCDPHGRHPRHRHRL